MTFALPEDEAEDTSPLAVKQESDEVKSSFEKRQEKVIIRTSVMCSTAWNLINRPALLKAKSLLPKDHVY